MCLEMHALAKMAEMVINRQNHQTVNKNSNEMAKGALWKVAILAKMAEKVIKPPKLPHCKQKFK